VLLVESDRRTRLETAAAHGTTGTVSSLTPADVLRLQAALPQVHVSPALLDYVQALIASSRSRSDLRLGLSPRAGQGLVRAARAWALLSGRELVLPEDVQAVLPAVAGHRLELRQSAAATAGGGSARRDLIRELVESVALPD
jgi:MoxR-like ATPase